MGKRNETKRIITKLDQLARELVEFRKELTRKAVHKEISPPTLNMVTEKLQEFEEILLDVEETLVDAVSAKLELHRLQTLELTLKMTEEGIRAFKDTIK